MGGLLGGLDVVERSHVIVFDKFHVLQHASAALDEVRRQEFFQAGPVLRAHGRGKRWLLLRRWKTVRGSKLGELQTLFAANRRLFKAYALRDVIGLTSRGLRLVRSLCERGQLSVNTVGEYVRGGYILNPPRK